MTDPNTPCCCGGSCSPAPESKTTPLNRRAFIQRAATLAGSAAFLPAFNAGTLEGDGLTADDRTRLGAARKESAVAPDKRAARYARVIERAYNGPYAGANLNYVAFPIGGIGAGMFCLEGTGALSHMSVRNRMEFFHEPHTYAAICVKGAPNTARVLEGPVPDWKIFGRENTGNGSPGKTYGFPRFREAAFLARFPFATVALHDDALPLDVTLTGWSPFTPGDADSSSLPVGALEYTFTNTSAVAVDAVFSFHTKNFLGEGTPGASGIGEFPNGFLLWNDGKPQDACSFAFFVDAPEVVADHSWFKGGWWDAATLVWNHVESATLLSNPPQEGSAPGASIFVPFQLGAGESRTIRLMTAWYAGNTNLRIGPSGRDAFSKGPVSGAAPGQQPVTGFLGEGLINSFHPHGDDAEGVLQSKPFRIKYDFVHFLLAGGEDKNVALELVKDGVAVRQTSGHNTETLEWYTWDVRDLRHDDAVIRIADRSSGSWGHVCVDHIVFSDAEIDAMKEPGSNKLKRVRKTMVFEDFEDGAGERWEKEKGANTADTPETYRPWYAGQFENVGDVVAYWKKNYGALRERSALFRDTFYDTTLPLEIVEAVSANLTILKSPTVLRQIDGRLWAWEGCSDNAGCCHGTCTHVWNYAQAIAHLFPELERSLRQTEYHEGLFPEGRQAFRVNIPITPGGQAVDASDGQLGGILKMYREWRIGGDTEWLRGYWPGMRRALDYMIGLWDPRETGLLEESHHNTYDINYFGPDGHCGSFYIAALTAAVRIGDALGDDTARYRAIRDKGAARLEGELYNGEYFYQQIVSTGLKTAPETLDPQGSGPGYTQVIELVNQQGPKYQYGAGCLSDGILGFWLARMCGLEDEMVSREKIQSNLRAIHKYNLRSDLAAHANPQRPSYALGSDGGLLLCTWPHGGALAIPFVYSNEVWTGIEYQVASHLMLEGMVDEGLEIVRLCRDRYDGVRRNPFNEYECGHWYARAMSSYGLLQGYTGMRYDAVDKALYLQGAPRDFRAFLCTAQGFGTAGMKDGKPYLEVKSGMIVVKRYVVDGKDVV
ncbi:MAG: hypothetical protein HYV27_08485 [Candidatus Hydrogenedentes bacterium]|nr:hypothetical protein [Candidatus Hydrogenedentota bacterium]